MRPVLLVTNDYPPKVGGIQSYLHELWRRLPPELNAGILTTAHEGADAFDAAADLRITRLETPMLLPVPRVRGAVQHLADAADAGLIVLDPALPLALLGHRFALPYAVVLHGAEVTIPARLPVARAALRRVLGGASLLIAAGGYPAAEARRLLGASATIVVVPPGVDHNRFRPLSSAQRQAERRRLSLPEEGRLVVAVSRLVPRKGFDVLIEAVGSLAPDRPDVLLVVGGAGRDAARLAGLAARHRAPVRFVGRVEDADLPGLVGAADVVALPCRDRWLGLEQEGFGIVFLEAAAAGVAALAGRSGGTEEAVLDGVTGLVADRPADAAVVTDALRRLLDDPELRSRIGAAARARVVAEFDYGVLARRLAEALASATQGAGTAAGGPPSPVRAEKAP